MSKSCLDILENESGKVIERADCTTETILIFEFALDEIRNMRLSLGVFRDRRPEYYSVITSPIKKLLN